MHVLQTQPDFNASEPDGIVAKAGGISPRREFLRLGAELSNRGQQPVSQFVSELEWLGFCWRSRRLLVSSVAVRECRCRLPQVGLNFIQVRRNIVAHAVL